MQRLEVLEALALLLCTLLGSGERVEGNVDLALLVELRPLVAARHAVGRAREELLAAPEPLDLGVGVLARSVRPRVAQGRRVLLELGHDAAEEDDTLSRELQALLERNVEGVV